MSRCTIPFECAASSPFSDLNTDLQELRYFDGLPGDTVLESLSLEQLHGDKRPPFEFSNVVNRADVGMIERRCSARFAAESLDCLRDPGNVVGEEFQRNAPAETCVLGFVDHAHPAAAQLFQEVVVGQRATDDGGCIGHWLDILR